MFYFVKIGFSIALKVCRFSRILLLLAFWTASFPLLATCPGGGIAVAQSSEEQANQQLEQLRREIQEYEQRISQSQSREKNLLSELEDFDRELSLRQKLVATLEEERKKAQKSLEATQSIIDKLQGEIGITRQDSNRVATERDSLAALVARRAIFAYKYFKRDVLKALLTSRSVVQMLTRQEYIKRIAEADRRNLLRLDEKNRQLAAINRRLTGRKNEESERLAQYRSTARYKERLIAEESSEAALLKKRRSDREKILGEIRKDQNLLRQQLSEKKLAAQRVENLIRSLEKRREELPSVPEVTWAPEIPFHQLKGKMNWPTQGRVVSHFGLQRNQRLATVTENPGIEIEAREDTPVLSVCTGQVTRITWLRGYGNTVIVDHQDGYYTVYAHLGTIVVREGQVIQAGEMLGRVGQSGSLEGPRLHFEVWAKREKQDPLGWLAKQ